MKMPRVHVAAIIQRARYVVNTFKRGKGKHDTPVAIKSQADEAEHGNVDEEPHQAVHEDAGVELLRRPCMGDNN